MQITSWLVCKAFLDRKNSSEKEGIMTFLPPQHKEILQSASSFLGNVTKGFDSITHLLGWTHYSWFIPILRTKSEKEASLLIASLPENTAAVIAKHLQCTRAAPLPTAANIVLQRTLSRLLLSTLDPILPIECIPSNPLHAIIHLSIDELHLLIELLGLYDLAPEMRYIIDKQRLQKIRSSLSQPGHRFFTKLQRRPLPKIFTPMNLRQWDGKKQSFISLLRKRGINRLSKTFVPFHADLIRYIKLHMSVDEAILFDKMHKKIEKPETYEILQQQILEAIQFCHTNKESS